VAGAAKKYALRAGFSNHAVLMNNRLPDEFRAKCAENSFPPLRLK